MNIEQYEIENSFQLYFKLRTKKINMLISRLLRFIFFKFGSLKENRYSRYSFNGKIKNCYLCFCYIQYIHHKTDTV